MSCLLSPGLARAGNDDELLVGNHAAMLGGAVSATVSDSSATWYNPAGLGAVVRDQFDVSATVYTLRMYDAPKFISTTSGASEDGSVTEFVVAPTQIAYVRRLSPGLSLGFGYFVPKASNFVLRERLNDTQNEPQSQWQISAAGSNTTHIGAVGVGVALTPQIRVGGSLIGAYSATTASATVFGAVSPDGMTLGSNAITSIATSSQLSLQLGFGMQLALAPQLLLGLTYRSPEVQLHASLDNSFNRSVTSLVDLTDPLFGAESREVKESQGVALMKAGRGGLSVSYVYGPGYVTGEFDVQPGLRVVKADVDRKAVWNARLGWYHRLSPGVALGLGLFTDRSGYAKSYDFLDGTGHFYGGTLGLELNNEHLLAPSERVSSLIFNSVFAVRYAFTRGDFGHIVGDPSLIAENPFLVEKGRILVHELSLYVGGGLHF